MPDAGAITRVQAEAGAMPAAARAALAGGPVMVVDTGAVARNFRALSRMTAGRTAAIVKGDGYGHGMVASSLALREAGAEVFFAARLDDALVLRGALGAGPVVGILDGIGPEGAREAAEAALVPVLSTPRQIEAWVAEGRRRGVALPAHVHLDTGLNRLGLSAAELAASAPALAAMKLAGYMTHLAAADDVDIDLCNAQAARLRVAVRGLPRAPLSIANSAGVFLGPDFHGDLTRPGKATFGINPLPEGTNPMEEPARVWAPVLQLRDIARGEAVGYSGTWRAPGPRRIATLGIGYANGFLRAGSNRARVAFGGRLAPVVGRVSMDLATVDVTGLPEALVHPGAAATILGDGIAYRDLAAAAGTNEHEVLIALGRGCRRFVAGGD